MDTAFTTELNRINLEIKKLFTQTGANKNLLKLTENNPKSSKFIKTEIILLTDCILNKEMQNFFDWLGVSNEIDFDNLFESSQELSIETNLSMPASIYHFQNRPIRQFDSNKPVLKIVFYNGSYEKNNDLNLAINLLNTDQAACLYFHFNKATSNLESHINNSENKKLSSIINIDDPELTFEKVLANENYAVQFQLIQLLHQIKKTEQLNKLAEKHLKTKSNQINGKLIDVYKKQLIYERKLERTSSRDSSNYKSSVNKEIRTISKKLDSKIENLDSNNQDIAKIKTDLSKFIGFKETISGKNLIIKLPSEAVDYKSSELQQSINNFYQKSIEEIQQSLQAIEKNIYENLELKGINLKPFNKKPEIRDALLQVAPTDFKFDKTYEKPINRKGIGQLLMELRTPLFLLMPFMMIFGVFGALLGGGVDYGKIDESILFYNGRPCIAITELPSSREHGYLKLIDDIELNRDPKKGTFLKEVEGELAREVQLATITKKQIKSGNKEVSYETLDYFFNDTNFIIYLYLTENADRQFVIDRLTDPKLGLLSTPSSQRTSVGIGALTRVFASLSDYRFVIFPALLLLVAWYIVTRKNSIDKELKENRKKEQKKMRSDLQQDFDRVLSQNLSKWKSKVNDYLSDYQNVLLQFLDTNIAKAIENSKKGKNEELNILQKRMNNLKTEKRAFSNLLSEHGKILSKTKSLSDKVVRSIVKR